MGHSTLYTCELDWSHLAGERPFPPELRRFQDGSTWDLKFHLRCEGLPSPDLLARKVAQLFPEYSDQVREYTLRPTEEPYLVAYLWDGRTWPVGSLWKSDYLQGSPHLRLTLL